MQPIQPAAPIPYGQITAMHSRAQQSNPALGNLSLRDFAKLGNYVTQSEQFAAADTNPLMMGLNDLSSLINFGLEESGASGVGADMGGWMGRQLGNEQLGRDIGFDLPRGLLNTVPLLVAAPLAAAGVAGAGIAGLAGTAAMTGMDVFERTGSPARAGLAGAAGAAMPYAIGRMSAGMLNNTVGQALTSNAASGIPARFGTNLIGSLAADTVADIGDIGLADERDIREVLTSDYWRTRVIANTAFAPLDAGLAIRDQVKAKVSREAEQVNVDRHYSQIEDPVREAPQSPIVAEEPFGGPLVPRMPVDERGASPIQGELPLAETVLPSTPVDVMPVESTLFGEPIRDTEPFVAEPLPEFDSTDLPAGKALNPFDLTQRPTDSALEWVQRVKNKMPETVEESRSQMKAVNEVRERQELAPVSDVCGGR